MPTQMEKNIALNKYLSKERREQQEREERQRVERTAQVDGTKPRDARPKLTAETVVDYIDWILANLNGLGVHADKHMQGAELAIRTRMGDAQNKATQHTLVEDGVIAAPPQAS